MQPIIEPPVTLIFSSLRFQGLWRSATFIFSSMKAWLTCYLVCYSSSFHLPCKHLASGLLHLLIQHISPVFLLNWMVPVLTRCLLCYSFYKPPYCTLGPTSNSTTDVTNFLQCPGLDSIYINIVSTNLVISGLLYASGFLFSAISRCCSQELKQRFLWIKLLWFSPNFSYVFFLILILCDLSVNITIPSLCWPLTSGTSLTSDWDRDSQFSRSFSQHQFLELAHYWSVMLLLGQLQLKKKKFFLKCTDSFTNPQKFMLDL